jgi:hypothetical protein
MDRNYLNRSISQSKVLLDYLFVVVFARKNLPIVSTADIRGSEGQTSAPFCNFLSQKATIKERGGRKESAGVKPLDLEAYCTVQIENSRLGRSPTYWHATVLFILTQNKIFQTKNDLFHSIFY